MQQGDAARSLWQTGPRQSLDSGLFRRTPRTTSIGTDAMVNGTTGTIANDNIINGKIVDGSDTTDN